MAIVGPKPILEIPSTMDIHGFSEDGISLEEAVREDFGEAGLTRFREYDVHVEAPINTGFKLGFDRYGTLKDSIGSDNEIGQVYQVSMKDVHGVSADNVRTRLDRHSDGTSCFSMTLDLNPANEQARYLKMLFQYR